MPSRRTAGAALAAAGLLAVPATASAASSVVAGPVKVKAYEMTLVAGDGGARDTLTAMLTRKAGKASQMHMYSFTRGVDVRVAGSSAKISGSLGRFGSVKLALSHGATAKNTVPKGCTGKPGRTVRGTLTGKLRLVADRTYFKTISARSIKAIASTGGSLKCQPSTTPGGSGGGQTNATMLMSSRQSPQGMDMLTVIRGPGGNVLQQATRLDDAAKTAPASVMHIITAPASRGSFSVAADLASASVTGAGPFFTGRLSFAGEGAGTMATGTLSGGLAARFDSIGAVTFAGASATLMRR